MHAGIRALTTSNVQQDELCAKQHRFGKCRNDTQGNETLRWRFDHLVK